jgi:predicted GNAT family acetyltransferase
MALTMMRQEVEGISRRPLSAAHGAGTVSEPSLQDEAEVLDFLAERPIHTVFVASLIRDNGLTSPRNRGSFYAYRDENGKLEGVALIGHAVLIEARSDASLTAFANIARDCSSTRLIRGERNAVHSFWGKHAAAAQKPRLVCGELLLEQRSPFLLGESVPDLRQASPEDLNRIIAANCEMAVQEAGISPLERDPEGFRERTLRRIEQGRVWVWVRNNKLMFKADIIAETPQAAYLEGVRVHPEERGQGYGLRSLAQLGRILLARTDLICLTVNTQISSALSFYCKAGYRLHSYYETIYLQ